MAQKNDPVDKPLHYTSSLGVECIDAIKAAMSFEQYEGWLRGNVFKYLWRYPHKNKLEDLRKAQFYLNRLITDKIEANKKQ
tara:strand:+ start:307 stop:549 length:243 start_codon:yes stop_codon:yes gene_type:complete